MFYFDMSLKERCNDLRAQQLCKANAQWREAVQYSTEAFGPSDPRTLSFEEHFPIQLELNLPFISS
jgi:hypothetical protein